jgi:hypothetical protein
MVKSKKMVIVEEISLQEQFIKKITNLLDWYERELDLERYKYSKKIIKF